MEILNVGLGEALFILVLALILLGPEGMKDAGLKIGKVFRAVIKSPFWRMFIDTTRDIREMPSRLAREAGVDEFNQATEKFRREYMQDKDGSEEETFRTVDPRYRPVALDGEAGSAPEPKKSPPEQQNPSDGEPGSESKSG